MFDFPLQLGDVLVQLRRHVDAEFLTLLDQQQVVDLVAEQVFLALRVRLFQLGPGHPLGFHLLYPFLGRVRSARHASQCRR